MLHLIDVSQHRTSDHDIAECFIERWSPRSMSGEAVTTAEMHQLFEAARWAPSCFKEQPWKFIYALRKAEQWPLLFDLLVEFNQSWCKNAGALIVICSHRTFTRNGKPNVTHAFDTGAAWQNFCLQAQHMKLVCHGMGGFNYNLARVKLGVPDDWDVQAMAAIGRPGTLEHLPEALHEKEKPSGRKAIGEFVSVGRF